ncbi:hypothetical protein V2J09_023767 [Rumex salicifolius]
MTTLVPIHISVSTSTSYRPSDPFRKRICCSGRNPLHPSWICFDRRPIFGNLQRPGEGIARVKHSLITGEKPRGSHKRVVLVRLNRNLGFNGGGGGGGGKDDGSNYRAVGNLVLAIGLTYLTLTDQLGWVLDTIFSIWIIAFLVPVIGVAVFLWWAGRDMIQSTCPNCNNDFQIFRSMINDELQLCPYCSQPFSVVDDTFVKEPVNFSNSTTNSAQPFNGFSKKSTKGSKTSQAIVDVEAEIPYDCFSINYWDHPMSLQFNFKFRALQFAEQPK